MSEIDNLKKAILQEYPRLSEDSKFSFLCHKGVPCFNRCCRDVNIFLTPYDIVRLRKRLNISSEEFLKKYTLMPFDENLKYPILILRMRDDEHKTCHFVSEAGCQVYEDRPWPCRMYPVGLASPKDGQQGTQKEFYFLLQEETCKGFVEGKEWTIREWLENQEIESYNEIGKEFKELTLHSFFQKGGNLTPEKVELFHMACYNVDKFRRFLFESSFFKRFEIDEESIEKLRNDDIELLKFGYRWLRFALFGEKTMSVRSEAVDAVKKNIEEKKKKKLETPK